MVLHHVGGASCPYYVRLAHSSHLLPNFFFEPFDG